MMTLKDIKQLGLQLASRWASFLVDKRDMCLKFSVRKLVAAWEHWYGHLGKVYRHSDSCCGLRPKGPLLLFISQRHTRHILRCYSPLAVRLLGRFLFTWTLANNLFEQPALLPSLNWAHLQQQPHRQYLRITTGSCCHLSAGQMANPSNESFPLVLFDSAIGKAQFGDPGLHFSSVALNRRLQLLIVHWTRAFGPLYP